MALVFDGVTVTAWSHAVAYSPAGEDRKEYAFPLSKGRASLRLGSGQTQASAETVVLDDEKDYKNWLMETSESAVKAKRATLAAWLEDGTVGELTVDYVGPLTDMKLVKVDFGAIRQTLAPVLWVCPFTATFQGY